MKRPPFVLGIAGGSGAGKTTLALRIMECLPADYAVCVTHDAYYRSLSHLSLEERASFNYDHPSALETDLCAEHVYALKAGKAVHQPVYDFTRHCRTAQTILLEPRPLIILEGILVLAEPTLRECMDLSVFVEAAPETMLARRVQRDVQERGRTPDSVRKQYAASVYPMYEEFVLPSRVYADIVIPTDGDISRAVDVVLGWVKGRRGFERGGK